MNERNDMCKWELANFCKGQTVNIFGFVDPMISAASASHCHCSPRAAVENFINKWMWLGANKTLLMDTVI